MKTFSLILFLIGLVNISSCAHKKAILFVKETGKEAAFKVISDDLKAGDEVSIFEFKCVLYQVSGKSKLFKKDHKCEYQFQGKGVVKSEGGGPMRVETFDKIDIDKDLSIERYDPSLRSIWEDKKDTR